MALEIEHRFNRLLAAVDAMKISNEKLVSNMTERIESTSANLSERMDANINSLSADMQK